MRKPNMFLCSWWADGKFSRTVRSNTLKDLRRNLACRKQSKHVYLHLGTIPINATDNEVETFMIDVKKLLQEKYGLKGDKLELTKT